MLQRIIFIIYILKSLRLYHSERSKLNELMDILRDVQMLYDKSLLNNAENFWRRQKKLPILMKNIHRYLPFLTGKRHLPEQALTPTLMKKN